jgi:hypothetical protein
MAAPVLLVNPRGFRDGSTTDAEYLAEFMAT